MEVRSVQIFISYERSFSQVFWEEEWLVGATPSTWNFGLTGPHWSEIADIQPIFTHSFSAVTPSEKCSINTNRKSTTRFPMQFSVTAWNHECGAWFHVVLGGTGQLWQSAGGCVHQLQAWDGNPQPHVAGLTVGRILWPHRSDEVAIDWNWRRDAAAHCKGFQQWAWRRDGPALWWV